MTKSMTVRWVKGTLVSAVAAVVCCWLWASLRERAEDVALADPDALYAGWFETLLAGIVGLAFMPVLLWAGMRVLGERGNQLLVLAGAGAWLFVGGHVVEDDVSGAGTAMFLALFALLGGLLALAKMPEK